MKIKSLNGGYLMGVPKSAVYYLPATAWPPFLNLVGALTIALPGDHCVPFLHNGANMENTHD
jgi:hypothetical protein